MKPFSDNSCELTLVAGTAWLSRFELARLAPGSVVVTDRVAGTGFELRLNGARIADADTLLVELPPEPASAPRAASRPAARLTARIAAFAPALLPEIEPVRGSELTALLPVTVCFGGARVPLEALRGLGRMSLVELGIVAERELSERDEAAWRAEATLSVAGMEAARGTVAVSGEYMALVIDSLAPGFPPASFADAPFASTGRIISAGKTAASVKLYDFSKPDCFTRRQIDSLAALHENALRSLALITGALPPGLRVSGADQLNFTEYLESLAPGEPVLTAPATASVRPYLDEASRPERLFLAAGPLAAGYPVETVEGWARDSLSRPVGGSILLAGPLARESASAVLEALRHEWQRYGTLSPRPGPAISRGETPGYSARDFAPFSGEWEMVAIAVIVSDRGHELTVAYPLRVLEPVLAALDS